MGAIATNVWIGSYAPSELKYQSYSFGSWYILFKASYSWICKYDQRECFAAAPSVGGRLSVGKTPVFDCLLYWATRCVGKGIRW